MASLFFIFVFSTVDSKSVQYKILPMTGFKLRISDIRSDHSANWDTTAARIWYILYVTLWFVLWPYHDLFNDFSLFNDFDLFNDFNLFNDWSCSNDFCFDAPKPFLPTSFLQILVSAKVEWLLNACKRRPQQKDITKGTPINDTREVKSHRLLKAGTWSALVGRRRWTTGLAQQSKMYGILLYIFSGLSNTQQPTNWAVAAFISFY